MKFNQPWISLILFCFAAVSAAALVFAAVVAVGSFALVPRSSDPAFEQTPDQEGGIAASREETRSTYTGLVTDAFCGARHRRYRNLTPTQCAAACIRDGASYVLVNGDHRYKLTGSADALTRLLGTRASVTGTLDRDTILVVSAAPLF